MYLFKSRVTSGIKIVILNWLMPNENLFDATANWTARMGILIANISFKKRQHNGHVIS